MAQRHHKRHCSKLVGPDPIGTAGADAGQNVQNDLLQLAEQVLRYGATPSQKALLKTCGARPHWHCGRRCRPECPKRPSATCRTSAEVWRNAITKGTAQNLWGQTP